MTRYFTHATLNLGKSALQFGTYLFSDGPNPYLHIHVADLTLAQQVSAAAGQGGVDRASACLDDLHIEQKKLIEDINISLLKHLLHICDL